MSKYILRVGSFVDLSNTRPPGLLELPSQHLVTHAFVTGMTGSGKTGMLMVLVEEALRAGVPTLMLDVKGDLPNLLLAFPHFSADALVPWVGTASSPSDERPPEQLAADIAAQRKAGLSGWGIGEADLQQFAACHSVRVITPGSSAGESLHVLSSLERRSPRWDSDPESARSALSAAVSLLLRLLGRESDPGKSKEHVLLCVLAERRLQAGEAADLRVLLDDLKDPPVSEIGALPTDEFVSRADRKALAAALNGLCASPTFSSWREGVTLDPGAWLEPGEHGRTPAVIVSVAHLDDDERALVLGVLLEEFLSWVRSLPGSNRLRALLVFDEVYGYLPPHPQNPPTKRPIVALMKQARAFGVGVVLATQNPMDVDYRALSNAGLWCIGRLQTDGDRERVIDGLSGAGELGLGRAELAKMVKHLAARWFLMRDAHRAGGPVLMQPRWAMSYLKGPMTRGELKRALRAGAERAGGGAPPSAADDECHVRPAQRGLSSDPPIFVGCLEDLSGRRTSDLHGDLHLPRLRIVHRVVV